MAAQDLPYFAQAFSSCVLFVAVLRLLTAVTSFVAEHRL